jgi:hypothetical protein
MIRNSGASSIEDSMMLMNAGLVSPAARDEAS